MKLAASISAALLALAAAGPAAAWEFLGQREVGASADRDSIMVSDGRQYKQIRICVEKQAVAFIDLDVVFGNGARQDVPVRARIPAGQCTRNIGFPGGRRRISRVNFVYEDGGWRDGRPIVRLYGDG
jgi:hypothetical protein